MSPETQSPGWEWYYIGLYFFVGGVSAGAFFIGSLTELFGGGRYRTISRIAYYIAFPLILLTPPLLIGDLGQPGRFLSLFWYNDGATPYLNTQSPLSIGSWALWVFAFFAGLAFVDNLIADGVAARFFGIPGVKTLATLFGQAYTRGPRKVYAVIGSAAGFFIAGYTGVLLNLTARPFWAATDPWMGALFIASATSTGAAAIYLVMALWKISAGGEYEELEQFDRIAKVLEIVLIVVLIIAAGQYAAPLMSGTYALLFWGGTVLLGILIPLALNFYSSLRSGRKMSSAMVMLMALFVLLGGALLRIAVVQAGQV
ncbi:MAG TPA: NrfD/PsrC family molybdoenzyme membrane anchor subunit [Anaerolineae bacterium]